MVEEAMIIKSTDIAKEICLPPKKLHCSMLTEDAITAAHERRDREERNQWMHLYWLKSIVYSLSV